LKNRRRKSIWNLILAARRTRRLSLRVARKGKFHGDTPVKVGLPANGKIVKQIYNYVHRELRTCTNASIMSDRYRMTDVWRLNVALNATCEYGHTTAASTLFTLRLPFEHLFCVISPSRMNLWQIELGQNQVTRQRMLKHCPDLSKH
jgi:hypothetical protein